MLTAINEALWGTICLAALSTGFTFINFAHDWQSHDSFWGLVSATFVAGAGFSIRRKFRVAAVAVFALYLIGRISQWTITGHAGSIVFRVLLSFAQWHGVRGTFAFHRIAPRSLGQSPQLPKEESERKET